MNLQTLSEWAAEGRVQELELLSLEGGFYLLRARLEQGMRTLLDARGEVLRLRSMSHVRELLRELPSLPCVLVQHVVHDEMCGMRDGPIEPLRLPFSLTSPW
ncbi:MULTISPECIES: DUF6482 family protein [Pseudomonas]|uniref:DUF6482 family protein n=1 Tax=Pseudomonas TaxID=286 RepID=UPI000CD4BB6D|nr:MULTISPECIES: DUF6482 family protein [Pseudomonas]RBH55916.1 metal ABC transporter ATPase [Pseudomonas sp. MWU13-2860]